MAKQPDILILICSFRLKEVVCWTSLRHDPFTSKISPRFRACMEHPWIIPGWNPRSKINGPQLRFPGFPCDVIKIILVPKKRLKKYCSKLVPRVTGQDQPFALPKMLPNCIVANWVVHPNNGINHPDCCSCPLHCTRNKLNPTFANWI